MTAPWDGGRGTVVVAARYSYTGELFSLLPNDTILRYGDYQLRVDHPLAGGQATLFAFGALDDVGWTNLVASGQEYGALQFHRLDLRWRRAIGGGRLLLGGDRRRRLGQLDAVRQPDQGPGAQRRAAPGLHARARPRRSTSSSAPTPTRRRSPPTSPPFQRKQSDLARSRQALSQAAYATVMIRVGERLVISPGAARRPLRRGGDHRALRRAAPRRSLQAHRTLSLRADGGRYAQMPSLPVSVPGFEAFGLADLGAQTSSAARWALETHLPGRFTLGVTGYYQKLRVTDVRNIDIEQHRSDRPRLSGVARRPRLRRRAAPAARRRRPPLRLAGLHALLEPALRRQRRARPLRLGRAAHPESRRRLPAAAALPRSARASTSTPGAGRRSSAAPAATTSSFRPTTRSICAPSAASSSIAS